MSENIKVVLATFLDYLELILLLIFSIAGLAFEKFGLISSDDIPLFILSLICIIGIYEIRTGLKLSKENEAFKKLLNTKFDWLREKYGKIEYIETGEENYKEAAKYLKNATEELSTYFLGSSWRNIPNELVGEKEFNIYWEKINSKISKGEMKRKWLFTVNNQTQFLDLLEDIKYFNQNITLVKRGYVKYRMAPFESDFPLLNILICKTGNSKIVFLGFSEGDRVDSAVIIRDINAVDDFVKIYNEMWERSIPIIDGMKLHYNNILGIGKKYFGNKAEDMIDKIREINE